MTAASDRFQGQANHYARFRPHYPAELMRTLRDAICRDPPSGGVVVDVGSGTGIFTRQLRAVLPMHLPIIGVEPAQDMRIAAEAATSAENAIAWVEGVAEDPPIETGSARAMLSATAAHWFDRPKFYAAAHHALLHGGLLGIAEYVRDEATIAAAAVEAFLRRHGGPRVYARPDYAAELRAAPGFFGFRHEEYAVTLMLAPDDFVGLALSSSHAGAVIAALGREAANAMLLRSVASVLAEDGRIPYCYRFHLFTVRRDDAAD